jgi:hypothetical protein
MLLVRDEPLSAVGLAYGEGAFKLFQSRRIRLAAIILGSAAAGGILAIGGTSLASIPDPSGVIHGCVSNATGVARIIDTAKSGYLGSCITSGPLAETAVSWNQTGPQGAPGSSSFAGYADGGNQQPVNCPSNYQPVSWGLIPPSGVADPPLVRSVQFNLGSPTGIIIDVFGDPGTYNFQLLCNSGAVSTYVSGSYVIS